MSCPFDGGKFHMEYGAIVGSPFRPNASAVRLDDRARDRQPEPHASLLRAVERVKQFGQVFRCDANATIVYGDTHVIFGAIDRYEDRPTVLPQIPAGIQG